MKLGVIINCAGYEDNIEPLEEEFEEQIKIADEAEEKAGSGLSFKKYKEDLYKLDIA